MCLPEGFVESIQLLLSSLGVEVSIHHINTVIALILVFGARMWLAFKDLITSKKERPCTMRECKDIEETVRLFSLEKAKASHVISKCLLKKRVRQLYFGSGCDFNFLKLFEM